MSCQQEIVSAPTAVIDKAAESQHSKKQNGKDLTKTKLCAFGRTGSCRYGDDCIFAHTMAELRSAPNLTKTQLCSKYMEGKCTDTNCNFAHGEAELRDRPTFKKKQCSWFSQGKCRNGAKCGFAHGYQELRKDPEPPPGLEKKPIAPPPGLSLTAEPESQTPEKAFFKMMAGRRASPLELQVQAMTGAIVGLQAKLSQLESMMVESQVKQMQATILELTKQCNTLQAGLGKEVDTKPRLNAKAAPFKPTKPSCEAGSDDSTSACSE